MITADTNIFVYAADHRELTKQRLAAQIVEVMRVRRSLLSLQLIGELQNVLCRKLKTPGPQASVVALDVLQSFPTFGYGRGAVEQALEQLAAGRLSYWDALLLASAAEAGCTAMLTEDMQDGARLFGLEIVNPFGPHGISPRAAELLELP